MYKISVIEDKGETKLMVKRTLEETKVYTEHEAAANRGRRFPIGRCSCPQRYFDGKSYETSQIIGATALISVGMMAEPVRVYCLAEHIAVEYTFSGKPAIVWICNNQTPGVILAYATAEEALCCDPRLKPDVMRRKCPSATLREVQPDVDRKGRELETIPLRLSSVTVL